MARFSPRVSVLAGLLLLAGCGGGMIPGTPRPAASAMASSSTSASLQSQSSQASAPTGSTAPGNASSSMTAPIPAAQPVAASTPVASAAPVTTQGSASPVGIVVSRPGRPTRPPDNTITVVVDVLKDRHAISPLIYGVNFPPSTNYVTDSGATFIRWGGNASTRYNWKNFDTNAASDWYFSNRAMDTNPLYQDSLNFVSSIASANASPAMTIGLLPWVAKDATSASFSVAKYGAQCAVNPFNSDQGNGVQTDCTTNLTANDPNDSHVPLLDLPEAGDPANAVYRNAWVMALSGQFGSAPHFYEMDNEMDIWSSTHRDVHPDPMNYHDLRGTFLKEAKVIKAWDPNAILFGPVSCCWWYYWNSAAGASDKAANASIDTLPWWLNEVALSDLVDGTHSLDVFDVHAYTDSPDTSSYTLAQKQALTLRITRDWWDPTYTSESSAINQPWATQMQPAKTIPFRIPRMRAILNSIYPSAQFAMTEWNEGLAVWGNAAESDFTTALADADALGIMGRERVYAAARWTAPAANVPAYQALKLFRNYDGAHNGFAAMSVSTRHTADPNTFSSYAASDPGGTTLTVLLINKDAAKTVPVALSTLNFAGTSVTAYTLSSSNPTSIVASAPQAPPDFWFLPAYSATLLVITGQSYHPAIEWDMNPDTIMLPANGTVDLHPKIVSGSSTLAITSVQSDSGITLNAVQPNVTTTQTGAVTISAGANPGFYHYAVTGKDGTGLDQVQSGWIVVGNPAATLTKIGDNQTAPAGSVITVSVTLDPGQSGGTGQGASILFTTDGGSLPNRIARTSNVNQASAQLTLPSTPGVVHVTAEGPVPLGRPVVQFTLTAQ
jgi:Glycoside hydrolase family 44